MKVVITGVNRFVRLNTVKALLEEGHEARADVRFISNVQFLEPVGVEKCAALFP